ncbi:MAG: YbjQ family protein [Oscillospiraceae bacterium]|nr:YbjQ family protein [Oscillospiraceae bacterium]
MVLVNTDFITGQNLKTITLVKGSVVQSKHIGRDIAAGFKTIIGGELKGYTEMLNESRAIATQRMMDDAQKHHADGIINVRIETASITDGAVECIAYGTAVKFV